MPLVTDTPFGADNLWLGSSYELAIEVSPSADDARLRVAISSLLKSPEVAGPWLRREDMGGPVARSDELPLDPNPIAYCTTGVPNRGELGSAILAVRESGGSDWLSLSIPSGMLERVFDVQYPLLAQANPWRAEIDQVLLRVAEKVYRSTAFDLAIVGEECSGHVHASELDASCLEHGKYLLSQRLFNTIEMHRWASSKETGLVWICRP